LAVLRSGAAGERVRALAAGTRPFERLNDQARSPRPAAALYAARGSASGRAEGAPPLLAPSQLRPPKQPHFLAGAFSALGGMVARCWRRRGPGGRRKQGGEQGASLGSPPAHTQHSTGVQRNNAAPLHASASPSVASRVGLVLKSAAPRAQAPCTPPGPAAAGGRSTPPPRPCATCSPRTRTGSTRPGRWGQGRLDAGGWRHAPRPQPPPGATRPSNRAERASRQRAR
jgi:hypothetical protein